MTGHTDKQSGWPAPRDPADGVIHDPDEPATAGPPARRAGDDLRPAGPSSLMLGVVLVGVVALAAAWFLLSALVMGNPAGDAFGEALGVGFALLIVVSVVGAARGRRGGGHSD